MDILSHIDPNSDIEHQIFGVWKRNWGEFFCSKNTGWIIKSRDTAFHNFIKRYYTEDHRHYHTLGHVLDCLKELEESFIEDATCPEEIRMAIWFHDLVYNTKATDNERRSADIARAVLSGPENELSVARICDMIKRTAHGPPYKTNKNVKGHISYDARILLDIDLSILSSDEDTFAKYEKNIRKEYEWVPQEKFASKRVEFLYLLLNAKHIYWTAFARKNWEDVARTNIEESIIRYREHLIPFG